MAEAARRGDRGGHLWDKDRVATSPDGSLISYAVRGPQHAPVIVGCAGYLCPDNFWRDIAPPLADDHRVVLLNYRGVGASSEAEGAPYPPGPHGYTMERLAQDVLAVADAEGVRSATLLGHSMGVQVALAVWRARPSFVDRLVLVAGPFASPLRTFYGTGLGMAVFPFVSATVPAMPRAVSGLALRALELPGAMPVARAIRALGPNTPDEGMRAYRWHLGRVDPRTAIWTARGMHAFDAGPWLHEIDVPTAMIVGDLDAWCPPAVGAHLVDRVELAELTIVPGASHALPIEFPQVLLPLLRAAVADGAGRPERRTDGSRRPGHRTDGLMDAQ